MFVLLSVLFMCHIFTPAITEEAVLKSPTMFVAILVRNKAHTLPYFLTLFEQLNYPKDRMYLWIRSDHNIDNSSSIVKSWLEANQHKYHHVDSVFDPEPYSDLDEEVAYWPKERYTHMIGLRESALTTARKLWADYILFLDADVFLTNPDTLSLLISKNTTAVGPMLKSDGLYSNFWCGMSEKFYYKRTEDYEPILSKKRVGCHQVPMVHSCVLVNLNVDSSDAFTFVPNKLKGYKGPHDDIITFALSTNFSGVHLYVCNDQSYGYVTVPLEKDTGLEYDMEQLLNIKLHAIVETEDHGFPVSPLLSKFLPPPPPADKLSLDEIYVINLKRRPERKLKMVAATSVLSLEVNFINAVDGRKLNDTNLAELGVSMLPGYADPYHKRPMKKGEIGCFLSHYKIWNDVIDKNYDIVMVLEDDVRFESFFRQKLLAVLKELKTLPSWDLIYLGRKKLSEKPETLVPGSRYLVDASYSYWTLGYLLSSQGAHKLRNAHPLNNMLPVDEFLPLLSGKHPEKEWAEFYPVRDLITWSVQPLLLYPMRYLNEEGYVSDTEDSPMALSTPEPSSGDSPMSLSTPEKSLGKGSSEGAESSQRERSMKEEL
uniref:Glycosyltransferase 25 family member n=1 Tax=Cacopsylla melanoneura TaxID=428564 RepID=A0A8D8Q9H1_9HEMI